MPDELLVYCPKCNAAATAPCIKGGINNSRIIKDFHPARTARAKEQLQREQVGIAKCTTVFRAGKQYRFPTHDLVLMCSRNPEFIDSVPILQSFVVTFKD